MTGSIAAVGLAAAVFVGTHFLLSFGPVRAALMGCLGEMPFRGLYSLVAGLSLAWLVWAYLEAPDATLWVAPGWTRPALIVLMAFAVLLVVGGITPTNPTAVGAETRPVDDVPGRGVFAITRHPMMWGIGLWAAGHLIVNGDAASVILFGSMTVLALCGIAHMDARRRALGDAGWQRLAASTSAVPFAALLHGRAQWGALRIGWPRLAAAVALYAVLFLVHAP